MLVNYPTFLFLLHPVFLVVPRTMTARFPPTMTTPRKQHRRNGRYHFARQVVCHPFRLPSHPFLRPVLADFTTDHFLKGHNYPRKVSLGIFFLDLYEEEEEKNEKIS
ncbi:hypothetical protein ElyMa_005174300 [Elysia marginata]|uniref:Secreted protein n=1 Tax=Elysia marginata TaxID=1093978 RepID=A0AAV4JUB3_9GAST|nr:hypothetical protein ElyMa_005174300 [Elysia marginata]